MSFLKLVFKPGINRDQTNYSGEGGWSDGDKIRFFQVSTKIRWLAEDNQ
jgi:hypothetical protein